MITLNIQHGSGEYPVMIGNDVLSHVTKIIDERPAMIVTDSNVAPLWLASVQELLPKAETLVLPAGETSKNIQTVEHIWTALAEKNMGRDSVLVALGGGVIGDMTGFAAACWMRGIDVMQLPTTLLAQVDASVGGKTAVDLPAGKNLIGAFHPPLAVVIDIRTLATLPKREYAAGMAEIIKAALIADAGFLGWLEKNRGLLLARDETALSHAIQRSCEIKAAIVTADEREHGERALLNLGHTFAHALETVTGYRSLLHGEAVAIGLVCAAKLSETQCRLDPALRPRLCELLQSFGLPVQLPAETDRDELLAAMRLDKKHAGGHWRLILLETPGKAIIREFRNEDAIRFALEE